MHINNTSQGTVLFQVSTFPRRWEERRWEMNWQHQIFSGIILRKPQKVCSASHSIFSWICLGSSWFYLFLARCHWTGPGLLVPEWYIMLPIKIQKQIANNSQIIICFDIFCTTEGNISSILKCSLHPGLHS